MSADGNVLHYEPGISYTEVLRIAKKLTAKTGLPTTFNWENQTIEVVPQLATCAICSEPFTEEEWEERHSTPDGEDCHEHCCPNCLDELSEAFSAEERNPGFRSW